MLFRSTLKLTIDSAVSAAAYSAMAGRNGAVLVSNYETGEIICMLSSLGFDPMYPPGANAAEGVYLNKAISSTFAPGSVFKIVTLAAAIENIRDLSTRTFNCQGVATIGYEPITCSGVHGDQTIEQAFANSCNVAFARLSVELGPNILDRYANDLGLVSPHSIDGIPTAAGQFNKAEAKSADLAWSGIGQYHDMVSPYSILRLCSAIANDGQAAAGKLISGLSPNVGEPAGIRRILSQSTANELRGMMNYNVEYAYGAERFPGLNIYAKTGTAEVSGAYPHAWFAGFIKDSRHPLAFTVVIENGGSGLSAAGSVANAVLQAAVA